MHIPHPIGFSSSSPNSLEQVANTGAEISLETDNNCSKD